MKNDRRLAVKILLLLSVIFAPLVVSSQILNITGGVKSYKALTNTVVTMTGRCELHIAATANPIPGCTINLDSPDAWFFLPNIPPSVVSANYLNSLLVNGQAAVVGGNCQLTEYAMGSVIIPQPPSFTPLQVFSGPNFIGQSAQFGAYTYYNSSAVLGAMYQNISSFILKRGYMATFAQNANGTGASQVYIAQDSDLAVGILTSNLDHQCSFIRVFPWRFTGKKGWGGSSLITNTAPLWQYDWGNSSASTANMEYVPIKWNSSSGTSSINNKQGITSVLGYNEPDSSSQANMTVTQAISDWPNMMQWGLRVGAPAVSDSGVTGQGLDWLYAFMDQANSLGYRVDFIPIHYYKCGWSTTQLSNYLAQIYETTGKPVWVTEWNNGASWCSSGLPGSQAAEATAISNDIAMLDAAPFVERYAIYQWFDPSTYLNLVTTNTPPTLTPAGVDYASEQSAIAYSQTLPPGGNRSIAQFEFESNVLDSSGFGNNGFAVGDPTYTTGHSGQAVVLDGTNSFIRLPPNLANSTNFTFAAWIYWNGGANWQRIFDFGTDISHYLFLTPSSGSGTLRFALNNGGGEQIIETAALPPGEWQHIAVTMNGGNAMLYTNGVLAVSSGSFTSSPASFSSNLNYLGKSRFSADPLFNGNLGEVQIADSAFTPSQISALLTSVPPQFVTNLIFGGTATQTTPYVTNLASMVTDADPNNTLTFTKISGAAWLNVAANGTLTGTPTPSDNGTNFFTIRVTNAAGASAFAEVVIYTIAFNANGIWNVDANGDWSDTNNWSGGAVANGTGYSADFSTVNITSNRAVTVDVSRSIGAVKFGNPSGVQSWTLVPGGSSVLTLSTGTGASPSIIVNQNTATIAMPLGGTTGFTKTGAGTLTLDGVNGYSGSTVISAGTLIIGASGQLGGGSYSSSIADSSVFSYGSTATQTLSGIISGSGALMQASGLLTLSGNNSYTGGTIINGGVLDLAAGGGAGAIRNNLTISPGGMVNLTVGDALGYTAGMCVTTVNLVGGVLNNASGGNEGFNTTFNLTGGTISSSGGYYNLNGSGAAINSFATNFISTISAPVGLRGSGMVISTAAGTVPGGIDLNISGVMADLQGSGYSWTKAGPGTLSLSGNNTNTGAITIAAGMLVIGGAGRLGNGNFASNILDNGIFNFNSTAAQTLSGVVSGTGGLTQNGPGTLTISVADTFGGNTVIAGGSLVLGAGASILNTPRISLNKGSTLNASASGFILGATQTLTGNGTILGNLTVNGTLAPGGTLGLLTCNNSVTLSANSTNVLELNKTLGTNDQLRVGGMLVCAGLLVVTNLSGTLAAGDNFKLFNATSYGGGFSAFMLPGLGAGLTWNTTSLTVDGTLSVVASVPPQFSSLAQRSDGNFQFNASGAAGVMYELDATTNLFPSIPWSVVTNGIANQSGLFQLVDLQATNFSQRFYRIKGGK